MSTPTDCVTGPLAYAPKWARDVATVEQRNVAREHRVSTDNQEVPFGSALADARSDARSSDDAWPTELSAAAPSLDPVVLPAPPPRSLLRVRFAIVGGLAISAAAGAITTLFVMEKLPSWSLVAKGDRLGVASFETRFIGQNAPDLFSYASQLTSINIARQRENQEAHLAEPLRGADHASSTATEVASAPAPANEEPRLAAPMREATADQASSRTTDGAAPSALASEDLAAPMREGIADQASSRTSEEPRLAEPPTVEHVTEPTTPSPHALPPDEIAAFLKRGQELAASGDIAAARVVLLRAAEARDPKAALALAATFDPTILERFRAYGVVPDVALARRWYEKAKEFGSEEAPQRLEMLARREM
jgi:hypothetical protein